MQVDRRASSLRLILSIGILIVPSIDLRVVIVLARRGFFILRLFELVRFSIVLVSFLAWRFPLRSEILRLAFGGTFIFLQETSPVLRAQSQGDLYLSLDLRYFLNLFGSKQLVRWLC